MLRRAHRFHGHNSLRLVYARGHTARVPLLSLKYAYRESTRPYRVAVVVSRKVNKSAVIRNRLRRRLYEVVRRQERLVAPGTDLVFTVFGDELAELEAHQLEVMVITLLQKAPRPLRGIVKTEGK
jgi:ribonuclease P protein component